MAKVELLPFDPNEVQKPLDLTMALLDIYEEPAVFAHEAIRTGRSIFRARYVVQELHCNPQTIPQLRGEIQRVGNRVTNSLIIDAEDPDGRPPLTIGHLRRLPLSPGNLGVGSVYEAVGFDRAMELEEAGEITFKGPGQPGENLVATADYSEDSSGIRIIEEPLVKINGREHVKGKHWVFTPSERSGFYLPQYRQFEIGAQMAGGGLELLVGPLLGRGRAAIYDGIGHSVFYPQLIYPGDEVTGEISLYRLMTLPKDGLLGQFDMTLFRGEKRIAELVDVSLGFYPEPRIMEFIKAALGGAS